MHSLILMVLAWGILAVGGVFAGILSSVFGLGGGLVAVPLLYGFFHWEGVFPSIQMHLAVGTSLVVMLVTTASVIRGRWRRKHIVLAMWKRMFGWVGVGAFLGAIVAGYLESGVLRWVFIAFLTGVILQTFLKKGFSHTHTYENFSPPSQWATRGVSFIAGFLSVMVGVGGSVFTLPLLRHAKLPMEYASGTAVALTPAVALVGAVMYVLTGLSATHLPSMSVGYLNVPAFLALSVGSLMGVPLGLKLSSHLSDSMKARWYRGVLVLILISMLIH